MTRRAKRSLVWTGILLVMLVTLGGAWWRVWYREHYPYGWSHSCDSQLDCALRQYAQTQGGWFPKGEATPEASLSLLYREGLANEWLLHGKTAPRQLVKEILERGDLLGPETCGWHYVEGLRLDDHPQLALFWDKVGLGHNGERLSTPGRWVYFGGGSREFIPADQWEAFLEGQRRLWAEFKGGR